MVRFVVAVALAGCMSTLPAFAAEAQAQAPYRQTLLFNASPATLNSLVGYDFSDDSQLFSYSLAADVPASPRPVLVTVPGRRTETIEQIFYLATTISADHLILGSNTAYASSLVGREFSSAFSGFSESELINALLLQRDPIALPDDRAAGSARLAQFGSMLFGSNAGFESSGSFALTSFSVGTFAGNGVARPQPIPIAVAVPEPSSWALMIVGIGAVGVSLRRRRKLNVTTRVAYA